MSSHSLLQKQEEAQSNNPVSTADIDNETIIKLVSDAVTAILTRLQSECWEQSIPFIVSGNDVVSLHSQTWQSLRVETRR